MTLKRTTRFGLLALAGFALCAGPALAQSGVTQTERQIAQTCMPDVRSYCSNVQRGSGRILACLRENGERLSPNCKQALDTLPR